MHFRFLFLIPLYLFFSSCSGKKPTNIGSHNGTLLPCPNTPNCVSTFSTDKPHAIESIRYESSHNEMKEKLISCIQDMERTKIIRNEHEYLYIEFTSTFWRFVDDVEFLLDDTNKIIHFRSASRLGKSDIGVNRKRMEMIRRCFSSKN